MSASEHLNVRQFADAIKPGEQLPMFMTPHEIGGMISSDFGTRMDEVPKRMRGSYEHQQEKERVRGHVPMPHKLDEVTEQVNKDQGIHTPVRVVHLPSGVAGLYDGHHRAATAIEHGDRLVPVEHYFTSHEITHDIKHANQDECYTCGKVPTEPIKKRSWG